MALVRFFRGSLHPDPEILTAWGIRGGGSGGLTSCGFGGGKSVAVQ